MRDRPAISVRGAPPADAPVVAALLHDFNVEYPAPIALLDELYVRPALRGRGIGGALLQRACALARERRAEVLEINVDEGDTGARRLYERYGFANSEPGTDERLLYYFRPLT